MPYQNAGDGYQPIEQGESGHNSTNSREVPNKPQNKMLYIGGAIIAIMAFFGWRHISSGAPKDVSEKDLSDSGVHLDSDGKVRLFDDRGRFVMEDYDGKPSFADFLPGVAGLYGKPVWCFYVNRGQGVSSFGTTSKDYPMLEFNAANKAYYNTPYVGFRTFIQGERGGEKFFSEPFSPQTTRYANLTNEGLPKRFMYVGTNEMEIKEINAGTGLEMTATYFVLPNEDFAALVRRTNIRNTGDEDVTISMLDGLAKIEPVGGALNNMLKDMGRTLEGWMGVYHADNTQSMPFYRLSTEPSDDASVKIEKAGHYCLAFIEKDGEENELLPIVYDGKKVFGQPDSSLALPAGLLATSVSELVSTPQYGDATTSSAFAAVDKIKLKPNDNVTVSIFYGMASHVELVPKIAKKIIQPDYVPQKLDEARVLVDTLLAGVETNTSNVLFDGLVKQFFLDNSLRGGLPVIIGDTKDETKSRTADEDVRIKVYHAFSRIHGDLERDYNFFIIDPTYFSQGPGNFRDVAQNRREDVFFVPRMGAFNIQMFLSFIQADGYNPLTVEAVAYYIDDKEKAKMAAEAVAADKESAKVLTDVLIGGPFRPGQMFDLAKKLSIKVKVDNDEFLNHIVSVADQTAMAVYGTGYWGDHWDYYLDLIKSYLAVYPENEEFIMYEYQLKHFFSPATCKPRSDKYVVEKTYDGKSKHILQLDATYWDDEKLEQQASFINRSTGRLGLNANWQQDKNERIVTSTPIAKLFLLSTIKFATRDAYGMGVEYEGGRPGWLDAMNGLVGMVGSGMPETYELHEYLEYILSVIKKYTRNILVPEELGDMIDSINDALDDLDKSGYTDPEELPLDVPPELFTYWDTVATARETYREKTQFYFSGGLRELTPDELVPMLTRWIKEVELGMARASKIATRGYLDDGTSGVPPSYFSYDVTKWEPNGKHNAEGKTLADPLSMRVGRFPLFLEGPVRMMKTMDDTDEIRDLYNKVKVSNLRDTELNMYFISADLKGQSFDMGRQMAFAPGWLENHSIWVHMSYKYYLQLLRGKLYKEFFSEMKGGGMLPYMDADKYGRSLMQCSSFLASSAFPDPSQHGRGFSARLSGSTAEFLSIWILMFIGPEPFFLEGKSLKMQLAPALPIWLFTTEDNLKNLNDLEEELTVSFKLFAAIDVTYHNSRKTDIFGVKPDKYLVTYKDGHTEKINGGVIPTTVASDIRRVVNVDSIDAYFH